MINHSSQDTINQYRKTAVKLQNVSMAYKLYNSPKDRMREALHPLRKKYHRDFFALKDINLEVKTGEILGIVGKNGSGKSTLLKIISSVLQPAKGTVQVNGKVSALLELGSGFNPAFTGMENIYFYGSLLGFSRRQMNEKVGEIVEFAEIGEFIRQPVKTYSSGMKARLAFAVSTAIDPEILILDEILSVGDPLFRRKCYARMENFLKSEKTILFVSHNSIEINRLCDRALLIDKGELILQGTSKLVTKHYERYLYAKKEDSDKIRRALISMNRDNMAEPADGAGSEIYGIGKNSNESQPQKNAFEKKTGDCDIIDISLAPKRNFKPKPFFIPNFSPKSTVEYRNYEVDIYDIKIYTLDYKPANALITNEEYIYFYRVKFHVDAKNVFLGMQIKTEKGLVISAASSRRINKYIAEARPGEIYRVEWKFKCFLHEGIYYTNAGVSTQKNGKIIFLNRIVDALVFKVQQTPNTLSAGLVHLDQKFEIIKQTPQKF